jgi:glycosyltransferase involved in cell wall biosynthesis
MIAVDFRFYDGFYEGGVYNIALSLIKSFNKNNHYLTVAVRSPKIADQLITSGLSTSNTYIIRPLIFNYLFDTFFFGNTLFPSSNSIIFWPYNCLPCFPAFNKYQILGLWDITPITHPDSLNFPLKLIFPFLMRYSASLADKILSCSKYDCCQIINYINPNILPTYIPLPITKLNNRANRRFIDYSNNPSLFLSTSTPLKILSFGNIYDRRLIPFLMKALNHLSLAFNINVEFTLVGRDATSLNNIDDLCNCPHAFKIFRHEYLSSNDLNDLLASSDLGVCLSDQDGTSYIILEYALSNLPFLTTSLMSEEVGNNCLVCDTFTDYQWLAKYIFESYTPENISKIKNMTSSAYTFVVNNFPDEVDDSLLQYLDY